MDIALRDAGAETRSTMRFCFAVWRYRNIIAAVPALGAALAAFPASAQFAVCNQTVEVVNVAMAQEVERVLTSEGWWTIGANRCVNVIKSKLNNRFIYLYGTDVFGRPVLRGKDLMCVGAKKFAIPGRDACWQRGYAPAGFLEIDTQAVDNWTVFIKPNAP